MVYSSRYGLFRLESRRWIPPPPEVRQDLPPTVQSHASSFNRSGVSPVRYRYGYSTSRGRGGPLGGCPGRLPCFTCALVKLPCAIVKIPPNPGHTYGHTLDYQTSIVRQEPPNSLPGAILRKRKASPLFQQACLYGGGGVWESNPLRKKKIEGQFTRSDEEVSTPARTLGSHQDDCLGNQQHLCPGYQGLQVGEGTNSHHFARSVASLSRLPGLYKSQNLQSDVQPEMRFANVAVEPPT